MTATTTRDSGSGLHGISHLVIEVSDAERAVAFYADMLGVDPQPLNGWPAADETALKLPSGQILAITQGQGANDGPETGAHQAYRCGSRARAVIAERLAAKGIPIHSYHEDRAAEAEDPLYLADPDGNRIQLVAGPWPGQSIAGIDHAAILASDMEWEEEFFVDGLGLAVDYRVGWSTADYVRARAWADGKEDMAPGTRRMDHRYRDIPGGEPGQGREVPRPNIQIFLDVGDGVLGVFLATRHRQEPPPERTRGAPRTAVAVSRTALDQWAEAVAAAGVAMEGPVIHPPGSSLEASLYFRDPCGNFLEFATPVGLRG